MFSRGVETLRIDGYLALVLLTHGELVSFHRLMKYGETLSMGKTHSSIDTYSYKCAAGLKRLLVEYLLMQNRHMTGEEKNPKTREEWMEANGGIPLLTDLCLAMKSDPVGEIRGLEEVVTCIYGPAVTYAFPDPLVAAYRHSVVHELPIWDDGRMIVEEGHIALKDEMKFATRKYRAPYGLEQVEMRQEGRELDAAGSLYVALTEYKKQDPATPSPLSVGTPGDKRSGPVEDRFRKILERRQAESVEESMDETLSETGEEMEVGNTPEPKPAEVDFTAQELLQDLIRDDWADTATPPLTSSPRKNLELPLTSETSNMGTILLSAEERQKNTFEGNRDMFLGTLDENAWRDFLSEIDQETTLDNFKEELWNTVVKFGEPVLKASGVDEKARKELLSKMVKLSETRQKTKDDECRDGSTLKKKTDDKINKIKGRIRLRLVI